MSQQSCKGNPEGIARVLITGAGGNVAQGIIKALSYSGLASHVVGTDANPAAAGFFWIDRGYPVPLATDPTFMDVFIDILNMESIDLVYVGADAETLPVSKLKADIEAASNAKLIIAGYEEVLKSSDKWKSFDWFRKAGVPTPETVLGSDREAIIELADKAGLPLLAKPRAGFASRGQILMDTPKKLELAMQTLDGDMIVQPKIGSETQEFTAATLSSKPGSCEACIVMHRELLEGTSYRIEPVFDESLYSEIRGWAERFEIEGPANFQFRMVDGNAVCFEINGRFSGTVGLRYHFGFNDPAMMLRNKILGEEIVQPEIVPGVVLRYWEEQFISGACFDDFKNMSRIDSGMIEPDENKS